MGFLKVIEKYAHVSLICVACIFVSMISGIVCYDLFENDRKIKARIKVLETEIIRLNNECVHMRELDTLVLKKSEYNNNNIKVLNEKQEILTKRVRKVEIDLDELYYYD